MASPLVLLFCLFQPPHFATCLEDTIPFLNNISALIGHQYASLYLFRTLFLLFTILGSHFYYHYHDCYEVESTPETKAPDTNVVDGSQDKNKNQMEKSLEKSSHSTPPTSTTSTLKNSNDTVKEPNNIAAHKGTKLKTTGASSHKGGTKSTANRNTKWSTEEPLDVDLLITNKHKNNKVKYNYASKSSPSKSK
jgi:hypothetical protein